MNITEQLTRDEGFRKSAYQDSLGYWTIGTGICIDARKNCGLDPEENAFILSRRIGIVQDALVKALPWVAGLSEVRRAVLVNMAYNLGVVGLMGFHNTLAHIKAGDYDAAASEMLMSKWAQQVGPRANRLAEQLRTDLWV